MWKCGRKTGFRLPTTERWLVSFSEQKRDAFIHRHLVVESMTDAWPGLSEGGLIMLPRFQHLLVPVNFTDKNWVALDLTFELAVQNKASVTLLHVIEPIAVDDDPEVAAFMANLERRATDDLASMAQRFQDAGVAVEWKSRQGKRAAEIVRYATERGVDLIVMNSHRIDPNQLTPASIGTLSHQVSVFCQCPVLLVK